MKSYNNYFNRILLCSICCIFLCIGCMVKPTWAWFAVSVENTNNVIEVGEPSLAVSFDGTEISSEVSFLSEPMLPAGEYDIHLENSSEADDLNQKSTLYVTFTIDGEELGYVMFDEEMSITLKAEKDCSLSWVVSWFVPNHAEMLTENVIVVEGDEPLVEQQPPTEGTGETTEEENKPTEGTGETTEEESKPTEGTGETTEEEGKPTEGTGETTEEESKPTEGTGETTEEESKPTEGTGETTEEESKPTEGTGETTEEESKPTEGTGETTEEESKPTEGTGETTEEESKPTEGTGETTEEAE